MLISISRDCTDATTSGDEMKSLKDDAYDPHMRQSSLLLMEQTMVAMLFSRLAMSPAAAGAMSFS